MGLFDEIKSDQSHESRGKLYREVTDTDQRHVDNIARQLIDEGWTVTVKTGTYRGATYWIMSAFRFTEAHHV